MNLPALPKIEMQCPGCGKVFRLSIKSINRRVACIGCGVEFVAIPGEDLKLDVRFVEVVCTLTRKTFQQIFQRTDPQERYSLVKSVELTGQASPNQIRPKPDKFQWEEFSSAPRECPGCKGHIRHLNNCCDIWFCDALTTETTRGPYAHCPRCAVPGYYTEPVKFTPGTDNKNLPAANWSTPLPPRQALQVASPGQQLPAKAPRLLEGGNGGALQKR